MSTEKVVTEKGAASLPTFDTRPCREAKLEDIDIDTTAFSVVVRDPGDVNLLQSCHELASNLSPQAKSLSPPLSPGTAYHYRAYTTNAMGTVYGEERTLLTN